MGEHHRAPFVIRPALCGGLERRIDEDPAIHHVRPSPKVNRKIEHRLRSMHFLEISKNKAASQLSSPPLIQTTHLNWMAPAAATIAGNAWAPNGPRAGVTMACIPFVLGMFELGNEPSQEAEDESGQNLQTIQSLRCALGGASVVQTFVATSDFFLGDPISGIMNCGISMLGMHSSLHMDNRCLPSYIVVAFCSGAVQLLLDLETFQIKKLTWGATGYALSNVAHLIHLASPLVLFLGVAVAFRLYVEVHSLPVAERFEAAQTAFAPLAPQHHGHETSGQSPGGFRAFSGPCFRLSPSATVALSTEPAAGPAVGDCA